MQSLRFLHCAESDLSYIWQDLPFALRCRLTVQTNICAVSETAKNFSDDLVICFCQDGATSLFLAAQGGHVTVIRLLVASGAKVNQAREVKPAPIPEFIPARLLLIHPMIQPYSYWSICLSFVFHYLIPLPLNVLQDGTPPLWMAAQMGHSEVVKVLLLRGADRDADRQVGTSCQVK